MIHRILLLLVICWDGSISRQSPDLAGYALCHGEISGIYNNCQGVVDILNDTICEQITKPPGTSYWAVRAYDFTGNQSAWSNELVLAPLVPTPRGRERRNIAQF